MGICTHAAEPNCMLIVLIMHGTCVVTSAFINVTSLNYLFIYFFFLQQNVRRIWVYSCLKVCWGLSSVHF